ncbi:MAG: SpoIIE family protein phosphatase [Bacteroidia bacterium]|nr:SpoIIE family protein phosphatase [Bacteroidia bacterium]
MLKKVLIFVASVILSGTELFSQQYFFRRYSVEEGLPQSSVYCLLQDSRGYIWMGTDGGGIARFDGQKFETFSKTNGLSDNVVRSLFEDSKGNILIGTDNGLTLYDGYNFNVIGKGQGLNGSSVLKITEGSNGIIWVATNDGGLAGLTIGDSISIANYSKDDGLVSDFVFDIYEDPEKKLWLGMVGGVNIIEFEDGSTKKIKSIDKPDIVSESTVYITSIEPGPKGTIWLGSHGNGLFTATPSPDKRGYTIESSIVNSTIPNLLVWDLFNRKDGELWIATDKNGVIKLKDGKVTGIFNKESGLFSNQILDILEDKEGNTWFASFGQGAMMYDDEKFISYNENNGITGSQILDILFDADNIFYVATEDGLSQFKKDGTGIKRLNFFTAKNGLNDVGANAIGKFEKEQIWIGTNNGINILNGSKLSKFPGNDRLGNKNICSLLADSHKNMWIGTTGGYGKLSGDNLYFMNQDEGLIHDEVQTIIEDKKEKIWMGTMGGLVRLDGITYTDFNAEDGLTTLKVYSLAEDPSGNIWIGTFGGGIFKFDNSNDSIPISVIATKGILSSNTINSLHFICDTLVVAGNDKGFDLLVVDNRQNIKKVIHYNINDGFSGGENNPNSISTDNDGLIWFGTKNGLVRYDPAIDFNYTYLPEACITEIKLFFEKVDWVSKDIKISRWSNLPEDLVLSHNDNHLTFDFTGFCYHNPDDLGFSYYLENQSKEWSPFSRNREVVFSGLTPGSYSFKVKARNKFGLVGDTSEFKFVIKPPFWQTPWFYVPASILFVFLIITIIRIRERNLIKEKVKLEKIVVERTREVVEQKDEIERQRDVVTYQKKEITDSINYAETIQRAVLPEEKILKKHFEDYFILFRPKDIVSGDFYWMSSKNDLVVFTAADCTGHGVPGAFMSMLGVSFLNKIVNESGIVQPSEILKYLRENIITALKQKGSFETSKDGMDIALCSVDIKKKKLWFSGANNPLLIIRKADIGYELIERKGDKMPVGFHSRMDSFTSHEIDIQKGDTIYLFSDGYMDQFGGTDGRKFMKAKFKQMLLDNQSLDMASQKDAFIKTLEEWINYPSEHDTPYGQIDDIILLGVRV